MNRDWSEQNKQMQTLINREATYPQGIARLLALRDELMDVLLSLRQELTREEFDAQPFINADGYHKKNIAYSLWHIFRIEDIVCHTLIQGDEQVFLKGNYQACIHSPIITTGNELVKEEIAQFSRQIDLDVLYEYIREVKAGTDTLLRALPYAQMKQTVLPEHRMELEALQVVSDDEQAHWLIDYWCGKDIRGLIKMPFSRHWIMHTEAIFRIRDQIIKKR